VLNILPYLRSIGVDVISITANKNSALAMNSKVVLHTPVSEEACPLDLAPTSSTTAALVVGDALSVALMKMIDFQPEHFAVFHPGGQLGKQLLLTVGDIMRYGDDNPVLDSKATVRDMLVQITSKRSGAVSVVDEKQHLLGLITDYDIRRVLEEGQDIFSLTPLEIMNESAVFIYSDEKAVRAIDLMRTRGKPFLLLPVLDRISENVVGMVHLQDLVAKGL
jgi:arabinose-5-phosphate isomerase